MAHTGKSHDKKLIDRANLEALDREIRVALEIADGQVQRKKGKGKGRRESRRRSPGGMTPWRQDIDQCAQCAMSTGIVIDCSTVRVAPPISISRKRECP